MKPSTKQIVVFAGTFLMFFLNACHTVMQKQRKDPAWVSEQFFSALRQQEYDKARALATERTVKMVNAVQSLSELGGGINIISDNKKELVGCETNGDEAVCTYKTFSGPEQKVYLLKVKGKWLVDLRRE